MFPYVEQPTFNVFGNTIYSFQILVCLAVIVGFEITVRRAPKLGLSRERVASVVAWTIVFGFLGSHWFDVLFYYPESLKRDPLILFKIWGSMSSFGGMLGGVAGGLLVMRWRKFSAAEMLRFVDNVAFAFPFAWLFGRLGCALAHDHMGVAADHWLAVQFPDGPRFDLGLLEFLFTIPIAASFFVLNRWRRWPDGFFLGLFFTLYAPARFMMDTLRTGDARYLGWTPGQFVSAATALLGLAILLRALRRPHGDPDAG